MKRRNFDLLTISLVKSTEIEHKVVFYVTIMSDLVLLFTSIIGISMLNGFPSIIDTDYPHIIEAEDQELYLYLPSSFLVGSLLNCFLGFFQSSEGNRTEC